MPDIKKTAFIFLSVLSCLVLVFINSCKKEQSPAKTNSQTTQTSFIVDDTIVANPTHSSFNSSGNFGIVVYGSGGNPELQIVFWGSQPPASGTYIITSGQPSFGKCTFSFSNTHGTSTAISGSVNVTEGASSNNAATFSNTSVGGSAGNHIIRGTITY